MAWLKLQAALDEAAPGVSAKTARKAVRDGKLKVARLGAGRNYVTTPELVNDWLKGSAEAQEPQA